MKKTASKPLYWAIGIFLVFILYKLYKTVTGTANGIVDAITGSAQSEAVKDALQKHGITDVRVQAVQDAAEKIYSAFHKDSFFGLFEDEPKAINALNSLNSIDEAKACAKIYQANYSKSLYDEFDSYVHWPHTKDIKTYLLEATKGL